VVVLNGVLTGSGGVEAGIERLYRITGQRNQGEFDIASFFSPFGFEALAIEEPCPHSIVQGIVAMKKV
jgi:hypothetical protein